MRGSVHHLPLVLIAALLIASTASPAQGQESVQPANQIGGIDDLRFEAHIGLADGRVVPNAHNPYQIIFANDYADFEGHVQVLSTLVPDSALRQFYPRQIHHHIPLTLPRGSRKAIEGIILCEQDDTEIEIRFVDESGRDFVPPMLVGFGQVDTDRRLVGVVTRQPQSWQSLLHMTPEAIIGLRRQSAFLPPDRVPDHWIALTPLSSLIWDGEQWPPQGARQAEAIETWVAWGGTLIVGTGSTWQQVAASPLARIVPTEFGESHSIPMGTTEGRVRFSTESPLVVTSLPEDQWPEGTQVLARLHGEPLLLSYPVGAGRVLLSLANLSPLLTAAGDNREALATLFVPPGEPVIPNAPFDPTLHSVSQSVAQVSRVNVPRADVIGRWMLAIWVVLVPINFLAGRALRRPRLPWALAPVIALMATAAIWQRGLTGALPYDTVQQFQFVNCLPGARTAPVRGVFSVYAPVADVYDITFSDGSVAVAPLIRPGVMRGTSERFDIRGGAEAGILDLQMGHSVLRSFAYDAAVPNPIPQALRAETHLGGVTMHWPAGIADAADRFFLRWEDGAGGIRGIEIPKSRLHDAGSMSIDASGGESLSEVMFAQSAASDGNVDIGETVLRSLWREINAEAQALSDITLIGIRREALSGLRARSHTRPQPFQGENRSGTAVLLAPISHSLNEAQPGSTSLRWSNSTWTADHSARYFGPALVRGDTLEFALNSEEDVLLTFSPDDEEWRALDVEEIEISLTNAPKLQSMFGNNPTMPRSQELADDDSAQTHVALFDWASQRWIERRVGYPQASLHWSDAQSFVHPLSGEVLAAIWATRDAEPSAIAQVNAGSPDPLDWRLGPARDRRVYSGVDTWLLTGPTLTMRGPLRAPSSQEISP